MPLDNWTLRKYPADKPSIILQASDTDWPYDGLVQLDHELDIYAEAVSLPAHIFAPGKHVGIYTKSITCLNDSEIVVSGKEGPSMSVTLFSGPKAGGRGEDAGDILLYTEDADLETLAKLSLKASGGKGGSGEGTKHGAAGGPGGDGGNGGRVSVAVRTSGFTATLLQRATAILRAKDCSSDQERQMCQDFISSCSRIERPRKDRPDHSGKIKALKAELARAGDADKLMDFFREGLADLLSNEAGSFEALVAGKVEYGGGPYGVGGMGTVKDGKNGSPGKACLPKVSYCYLQSNKLRQLDMPIAHPDQCAMVLHLAKLDYYLGSSETMKYATDRLIRLHDRLLFLDGLQPTDPIYAAYKDAETKMHLLPRKLDPKALDEPAGFAGLREVATEVDALLRQIALGIDFYGHKPEWVPRGSYDFYANLTKEMLGHAKFAEQAWRAYHAERATQDKMMSSVREMRDQAHLSAEAARDFVVQLRPFLESTVIAIGALDFEMKECKKDLVKKLAAQADAISRVEQKLGVDFNDVIEAATMVAFCPEPAMILIQGSGLAYKAVKDAKIADDDGEPGIKKELLVKKMTTLGKGVGTLVQRYRASMADGRTAEIDDPGADKLLAKKEDYMELVSNYQKAIGEHNIEEVSKAFDDYIDAALERNNTIMTYNATVNIALKKRAEADAAETKAGSLSDTVLANISPDLPAIGIFMEKVYSESLWALLESLSMTQRALRFWSLSTVDEIKQSLQNKPPALLDAATLSHVRNRLVASYGHAVESFGKEPQRFEGLRYELSSAEVRRWRNHPKMQTIVRIKPAFRDTTAEESPFYGKSNVRLHTVRFFAEGAKTQLETMHVLLTHLGEEVIVDAKNQPHTWIHEQLKVQFQYRLADMSFTGPGTVDGTIGAKVQGKYAMVGPFASWLVDVNPAYNTGIDITDVSRAWLEFSGEFDSL